MQLYSSPISPYASRCRIQILHKNLPIDIVPPPGGMSSDEVRAKNPLGKIPVLDLGEQSLSESWAIMEYLESQFPDPAMRSADAFQAAQVQALVRFTDLYLAPAMFPMFLALRGAADQAAVDKALTDVDTQMAILDQLLADKPSGKTESLDLADAALLPIVWYAQVMVRHFGKVDCIAKAPTVQHWWNRASQVTAAATVLAEMEAGLKAALPMLFES